MTMSRCSGILVCVLCALMCLNIAQARLPSRVLGAAPRTSFSSRSSLSAESLETLRKDLLSNAYADLAALPARQAGAPPRAVPARTSSPTAEALLHEYLDVSEDPQWPLKNVFIESTDGVALFTSYWVPLGMENVPQPAVLDRSPYGPFTEETADIWLPNDFVAVMSNLRGTGLSDGDFSIWHDAHADGAAVISWMVAQPWSTGDVMATGISADGMTALAQMIPPQASIKSMSVIFATGDGRMTAYPNGALHECLVHGWLDSIHDQRPWNPPLVPQVLEHEAMGPWWANITLLSHAEVITIPSVWYAGWYDIFLQPMLDTYNAVQFTGGSGARGEQKLVIGTRGHCFFESYHEFPLDRLAEVFAYEWSVPFFQRAAGRPYELPDLLNTVTMYIMGSNETNALGNYWTTLPAFPDAVPQTFFLGPDHSLSREPVSGNHSITYTYDPHDPVPSIGGNNLFIKCGPMVQNSVESRPDVLLFDTPVFDYPMAMVGSMNATLYVSSNRNDTDFTVKVTDVYDNGSSMLLTDNVLRMRWRATPYKPVPMEPGFVYKIEIELWSLAYIFNTGHRLRLAVSSSCYPRFSVNPNNGLPLVESGPLLVAQNSLHMGADTPSSLTLPIVYLKDIPDNIPPYYFAKLMSEED